MEEHCGTLEHVVIESIFLEHKRTFENIRKVKVSSKVIRTLKHLEH